MDVWGLQEGPLTGTLVAYWGQSGYYLVNPGYIGGITYEDRVWSPGMRLCDYGRAGGLRCVEIR